ncbi:PAS domain-containing protein [Novosphingobium kaempferiae]|uniref:PAS domain-containing protein n=1 Tax=Novosphingobium kaempferiae TaxID=2896849 RepID=UPI001E5A778F|nr:PAS domain-containing protein [Novosphingobium kaempferiae]
MDSARDFAVVAVDLEGTIIEWSQGAERIMGWSEAEALGREASLFFTPEDREAGRPALEMREARQHGKANDERWHLRKGGGRFWASGDTSPLTDRSGTHIGYRRTAFSVSDYMDHTASGPAFLECRMVMRTRPFAMEAFATRVRKMTKC